MTKVLPVRAFQDNYIWLIAGGKPSSAGTPVAIVDPGDADPVLEIVHTQNLLPVAVLCTHHHGDHVGGVADILMHFPVPVYGPAHERIQTVTQPLHDGDKVDIPQLGLSFIVFEIPGHTAGHIAFYGQQMLFCGDTLFSAGCGRLFEGTAEQMRASLNRLAALPGDTAVYCGHEYTLANLRFALTVEPDNADIRSYLEQVKKLRTKDLPTLPSNIGQEHRINPFFHTAKLSVREAVEGWSGHSQPTEIAVFATLRRWKDGFNG